MSTKIVLPPEWAPQTAVMVTWPHENSDWAQDIKAIEHVYLDVARQITRHEHLLIVCRDTAHARGVKQRLAAKGVAPTTVYLACAFTNDTWTRDYGPISVYIDDSPTLLNFRFNGWGSRYKADLDDALNHTLSVHGIFADTPMVGVELILEGGSIDTDGQGTLLTTHSCLRNPNRNPHLAPEEIDRTLMEKLGINRILWLTEGVIIGDDTDGHVDNLARFCDAHTIAYSSCGRRNDAQFEMLKGVESVLRHFRTRKGNPYRLVPLPLPSALYNSKNQRLPANYVNFLIINNAVLVPQYSDPADAIALHRLNKLFPDRQLIGIDCRPLIKQYGSLHCMTMQFHGVPVLRQYSIDGFSKASSAQVPGARVHD